MARGLAYATFLRLIVHTPRPRPPVDQLGAGGAAERLEVLKRARIGRQHLRTPPAGTSRISFFALRIGSGQLRPLVSSTIAVMTVLRGGARAIVRRGVRARQAHPLPDPGRTKDKDAMSDDAEHAAQVQALLRSTQRRRDRDVILVIGALGGIVVATWVTLATIPPRPVESEYDYIVRRSTENPTRYEPAVARPALARDQGNVERVETPQGAVTIVRPTPRAQPATPAPQVRPDPVPPPPATPFLTDQDGRRPVAPAPPGTAYGAPYPYVAPHSPYPPIVIIQRRGVPAQATPPSRDVGPVRCSRRACRQLARPPPSRAR
jgi:hypothetical protein